MRVAFFGTPAYAVPTLDALVEAGHELVTVVAQPDKPVGRGRKLQSPPVVERARALGLETRQPRAVRRGRFVDNYCALELDVAVVVAYGRILIPEVLAAPRLGSINGHGSLLPRWRGAAPIQWALLSGDARTGVTTMQMDAGLDTGDMLLKRELLIGPELQSPELFDALSQVTAELIVETLARLEDIPPEPQDEAAATHAPMLEKEMGALDWSWPARTLHDRVRALQPWPGTWGTLRGDTLKVKQSRVVEGAGAPGEVLEAGKRLVVACGEGALEIVTGQLPGKPPRSGQDLVNGARIEAGETLESGR
ncbi:MAG: methionyl-tRNA formyltransferase [Alphaproteobacteria bacterium]|nr:methionyl-tRNA formyltransferase [Alphaproteobacteria bacterium]MCB9794768.1 methionyl-tRNA formyltransferase [Alphaproteobacteria bacterium]